MDQNDLNKMDINPKTLEQLHTKLDALSEKVNHINLELEKIKVFEPKEMYNRLMKIIYTASGAVVIMTFLGVTNIEKLTKVEEQRRDIASLKELVQEETTKLREHIIKLQERLNHYENVNNK